MDKRGFIKTLEAVLAVIIVFIFIFTVRQTGSENNTVATMRDIQEGLLTGISQDEEFRECIVSASQKIEFGGEGGVDPCGDLKTYIDSTLPSRFTDRYVIQACDPSVSSGGASCSIPSSISGNNVYTSAVIISSDLNSEKYNPKIFRIWMW